MARNEGQYLAGAGIPGVKGIPGNRATRTRGVKGKKGVKGYKGHPGQVTIRSVPYRGHEKGLIGAAGQVQGTGKDLTLKGAVGDAGLISVTWPRARSKSPCPPHPLGKWCHHRRTWCLRRSPPRSRGPSSTRLPRGCACSSSSGSHLRRSRCLEMRPARAAATSSRG